MVGRLILILGDQLSLDLAGLKAGDRWCVCAGRFLQAAQEFAAPKVVLSATHIRATDIVPLELLQAHAVDATG